MAGRPNKRVPAVRVTRRTGPARFAMVLTAAILQGCAAGGGGGTAMTRAAEFMISVQQPDGLFAYEFDLSQGVWTGRDNVVRQAGAAYGLAEYFAHTRDRRAAAAVRRSLRALSDRSRAFEDGYLLAPRGRADSGNAGATALALLAELHYYRASGDGRFEASRAAWTRGLAALHVPGRGFRKSAGASEESPYYNGEAWLALAYRQATEPDPALARRLEDIDGYMIATYGRTPHIGFFHWGAMAARVRHEDTGDPRFVDFAAGQSLAFVDDLRPAVRAGVNSCYAVEGLVAAREVIAADGARADLRARLATRIDAEMAKNLRLQVGPAQLATNVGFLRAIGELNGAFAAGQRRKTLRIDHTQHCLSALVKMARARLRTGS